MADELNKWHALAIQAPAAITDAGSSIADALHTVKTGVEAARALAELARVTALNPDTPTVTAANALIRAAVAAIEEGVDALLDDAGAYALVIPLPKKGLLAFLPSARDGGTTFLTSPTASLLKELDATTADEVKVLPTWQQAFNPATLFVGGNAWFLRTVSESLSDAGDQNRPKFGPESYWAYTMLVAGGQDITSVLDAATYFTRLMGLGNNAHEVPPDRSALSAIPKNVRVSLSGRENRVVVTWENVPSSQVAESFDSLRLVATKYAIIRSSNFLIRSVRHVRSLFGSRELEDGMTGELDARVMAVHNYDGIVSRWTDNTTTEPETDFYYSVCFKVRIEPPSGDITDLPFDELSSWSPIRIPAHRRFSTGSGGTLPDWVRTPSVAEVVPPVARFIDTIKEELQTLRASTGGLSDRYTQVITFLTQQVEKYAAKAQSLTSFVEQLNQVMTTPSAGIHAYIGTGKGPTGAFLADMTKALESSTDEDRPPYDLGTEYVTGVMILAVGPDPSKILRALEAFKLLFGTPDSDPMIDAINHINTTLTAEADALASETSDPVAFDDAMRPTTGPDAGCRS